MYVFAFSWTRVRLESGIFCKLRRRRATNVDSNDNINTILVNVVNRVAAKSRYDYAVPMISSHKHQSCREVHSRDGRNVKEDDKEIIEHALPIPFPFAPAGL